MTAQRNLSQSILQVVFSIFLGLVVTGFVGIAVNTFLPEPAFTEDMPYNGDPWQSWRLATALTLLVAATLIMVAALLLGDRVPVLATPRSRSGSTGSPRSASTSGRSGPHRSCSTSASCTVAHPAP